MESSRLAELKYAIFSGTGRKTPNFTHALKICLGRLLSPLRSARLTRSGGNRPSSRFNWHKVWTGVKCKFSSAHHHNQYVVGKLPISQVRMWYFTRIGRKTKKLWLSIIQARRRSDQPGLWPPQKGVNYHFSSPQLDKPYIVKKLSILASLNMQFQEDWPKDKNYIYFNILPENFEKFHSTELYGAPLEGSTIFLLRKSTSRTPLESSRLAELKYAIFSRTGHKT